MPRTARASVGGLCYHVINRANGRTEIFHKAQDYQAFAHLLRETAARIPMRVLAYCVMPNHFHAAVWPHNDSDLSRWMQWLLTAHVRRYHGHYHTSGHIWQGRFKAFPIEEDGHLLTVLRYIERNPLRAGLVSRAEDWQWSSLRHRSQVSTAGFVDPGPVAFPEDWMEWVNQAQTNGELEQLRASVNRGMPFGSDSWVKRMASILGLEFTLRQRGRPRRS
jgi:putative transposase